MNEKKNQYSYNQLYYQFSFISDVIPKNSSTLKIKFKF